jgi:chloramphenicol 3-O phosphotransferase
VAYALEGQYRAIAMLMVLSGTSSSGKTSLAEALQARSPRPLLHLEADRFAPTLQPDHPALQDADFRSRVVVAMHEAIAAFGRGRIDIIVDGSLPTEHDLRDRCLSILRGVPGTKVIAVRCSLESLREREAARSDRQRGWAEQQMRTIYEGVDFDFTVDTTDRPSSELAVALLESLFPS